MEYPAKKPNLLLIMTDQQRWDALGAAGNPHIRTPNLDRLCASGVRFSHGYSEMPECVPARAMIATGTWGHRSGVMDNKGALPAGTETFYKRLSDAGYNTFAVGKMHINPKVELGFGVRLNLDGIPHRGDHYYKHVQDSDFGHVKEPHGIRCPYYYVPQVSQLPPELHGTVWVGDHAVRLIEERKGTQPWFGYVSFLKPHPPFDPSIPYLEQYDPDDMPLPARSDKDREQAFELLKWQTYFKWMDEAGDNITRLIKASYYALIQEVDDQVGRILDTLETTGQRENTLILFVSDHGELLGDHYQWGKRFFYDGAMRVPYILSQPGTLPQNIVRDALVGHLDIEATFMSAAGLKPRGSGMDVRTLVAGETEKAAEAGRTAEVGAATEARGTSEVGGARQYAFGEFSQGKNSLLMAWDGTWKFIYSPNGGRELLFHAEEDPYELNDLSDVPSAAAHKERLREALVSFLSAEEGAQVWLAGGELVQFPLQTIPLERYKRGKNLMEVNK
jgi:arylsulfatase